MILNKWVSSLWIYCL